MCSPGVLRGDRPGDEVGFAEHDDAGDASWDDGEHRDAERPVDTVGGRIDRPRRWAVRWRGLAPSANRRAPRGRWPGSACTLPCRRTRCAFGGAGIRGRVRQCRSVWYMHRWNIDVPGLWWSLVDYTPLDDATLAPFTVGRDLFGEGSLVLLPTRATPTRRRPLPRRRLRRRDSRYSRHRPRQALTSCGQGQRRDRLALIDRSAPRSSIRRRCRRRHSPNTRVTHYAAEGWRSATIHDETSGTVGTVTGPVVPSSSSPLRSTRPCQPCYQVFVRHRAPSGVLRHVFRVGSGSRTPAAPASSPGSSSVTPVDAVVVCIV